MDRLAAVAVALVLAACTAETSSLDPEPSTRPRPGGSAVVGVIGEPATLDPYSPRASVLTHALVRPLYPSLFRLDPDGTPHPYLAAALHPVRAGARVRLRPASWSDGSPITAADVVASARRARAPSGFSGLRARAVSSDEVIFNGRARDWGIRLATAAFVLKGGRADGGVSGGPFMLDDTRPGLGLDYVRNEAFWGPRALLDSIEVRFVQGLEFMLPLLDQGRLDVASIPYSVNLEARLDALGVHHGTALGWETIVLDLGGSSLSGAEERWLWGNIDLDRLHEGLIRQGGSVIGRGPEQGPTRRPRESVSVAVATGDELTGLIQRALFRRLRSEGIELELVTVDVRVFDGAWEISDPTDVAIRRRTRDPANASENRDLWQLFRVVSLVAWTDAVLGPRPNPTLEGPLWNAGSWARADL